VRDVHVNQDGRSQFEALVREWEGLVYGLALRMLGNAADAEDATQEIFLRLLRKLHRYDPARSFRPWFLRLAANILRNALRDATTRAKHEGAARARGAGEVDAFFVRRGAEAPLSDGAREPRLLPRYDPLLLGHKDTTRYLDARDHPRVFRPAAVVEPVVLADGRVVGTWSYDEPPRWKRFRGSPRVSRWALGREAARVAAVLRRGTSRT